MTFRAVPQDCAVHPVGNRSLAVGGHQTTVVREPAARGPRGLQPSPVGGPWGTGPAAGPSPWGLRARRTAWEQQPCAGPGTQPGRVVRAIRKGSQACGGMCPSWLIGPVSETFVTHFALGACRRFRVRGTTRHCCRGPSSSGPEKFHSGRDWLVTWKEGKESHTFQTGPSPSSEHPWAPTSSKQRVPRPSPSEPPCRGPARIARLVLKLRPTGSSRVVRERTRTLPQTRALFQAGLEAALTDASTFHPGNHCSVFIIYLLNSRKREN